VPRFDNYFVVVIDGDEFVRRFDQKFQGEHASNLKLNCHLRLRRWEEGHPAPEARGAPTGWLLRSIVTIPEFCMFNPSVPIGYK